MKRLIKAQIALLAVVLMMPFCAYSASTMYFVHNDHLGTPQFVTDGNEQVVWEQSQTAFGEAVVDEDPDGDSTSFTYNQRFPGQYFDEESNLHYNYFRDYDPTIGRYVQSDPIGLNGGINTYSYVGGNPVNFIDLYGLKGALGALAEGGAFLLCLRINALVTNPDGSQKRDTWLQNLEQNYYEANKSNVEATEQAIIGCNTIECPEEREACLAQVIKAYNERADRISEAFDQALEKGNPWPERSFCNPASITPKGFPKLPARR